MTSRHWTTLTRSTAAVLYSLAVLVAAYALGHIMRSVAAEHLGDLLAGIALALTITLGMASGMFWLGDAKHWASGGIKVRLIARDVGGFLVTVAYLGWIAVYILRHQGWA
jgi:hypothetical protein